MKKARWSLLSCYLSFCTNRKEIWNNNLSQSRFIDIKLRCQESRVHSARQVQRFIMSFAYL